MNPFLSPHIALITCCITYMVLGAYVFQALEKTNLSDLKQHHMNEIEGSSELYLERIWQLMKEPGATKESVKLKAREEFGDFVDTVYDAYKATRHRYDPDAPVWDFRTSLFFTATMLTSIGYGFIVPFTFYGRMFCVVYCLVGIPLTLVTVANIAKFISESVFMIHYQLWKWHMQWKSRRREQGTEEENKPMIGESEDEEEILDRTKLVRFPPIIVFIFVFVYGMIGAYLVHTRETNWSYTESMYFTFISILTVGFGDYRPTPHNLMPILAIVIGGIILTTMCMDVVGRMYLKEIHYWGRKLKTNNPFYLLREAKARRRRQALAGLLAQLARGMIFAHRNYAELSKKKEKKKRDKRRASHVLPDQKFMFARQPPDPPSDCQVVSTSAYSVRLAWAPAFSSDSEVIYNIRYKLKHKTDSRARELRGIHGTNIEIMNVESCSLYEFKITAVSQFGESKPVILVQYTEPQLSPQHILAKKLTPNTIELSWEPPFKRTHEVKHYIVYYTDNPNSRLAEWEKCQVFGSKLVFPDLKYDWFYMFSATAVFNDGQRSPLSRALFIKTDKLEYNKCCIGQSRTIEVMESISDREETSEVKPLLKRDYCSIAF
uniref:Fibronectin type-III domain-containing protein n=1 Tax=Plectus sambesii TaxID=2011161 RepID=A0A914WRW4_9BILA